MLQEIQQYWKNRRMRIPEGFHDSRQTRGKTNSRSETNEAMVFNRTLPTNRSEGYARESAPQLPPAYGQAPPPLGLRLCPSTDDRRNALPAKSLCPLLTPWKRCAQSGEQTLSRELVRITSMALSIAR
jgi:hypothetical protein